MQLRLFETATPSIDEGFANLERIDLDATAWVDFAPGWVSGSDAFFDELVRTRDWKQRTRRIFDQRVLEPRLTALYNARYKDALPVVIERMRQSLSRRYGVTFDSIGF